MNIVRKTHVRLTIIILEETETHHENSSKFMMAYVLDFYEWMTQISLLQWYQCMRVWKNESVLVPPGCATTAVAMYGFAEAANVPLFGCPSAGSSALALNVSTNISPYPLLIQVPFGLGDLTTSLVRFFSRYNYTHLSIFRDDALTFFSFTSKYLMNTFRVTYKTLFRSSVEKPFTGTALPRERITVLLQEARDRSRGTPSNVLCRGGGVDSF